ncbi:MAG: 4-hydroxy-3-methylbut-2-enyl diphosphate reductase [Lachnospiraceae bacterium]|nr:4-hydroxy-3-methylbut-2-enyl diphosphate reductase [Lachnospiraceae bacterium]
MAKEVVISENAGFCYGAGRGVDLLNKAIEGGTPIYTYGPILHNDKLIESFEKRGVKVINDVSELKDLPKGLVVIRCHGVEKSVCDAIEATGNEIYDATCPFVKRIHKIVAQKSAEGEKIVVIGNPKHAEVIGIVGWSSTGALVLETEEQVRNFKPDPGEKICIVAQTTFNRNKFQEFLDIFQKNSYNMTVMNTICDATRIRQAEADELSAKADTMIVIGDEKSSNSRKLFDICKKNCANTYFIQTVDDIKGKLSGVNGLIGITAGASTPRYIIEEVQSYVRNDV